MINDYVSLDLETTGLNPKHDRIIEIGAVKVKDGKVTETFQTFVNPGRVLNKTVCELTGITEQMLEDAPEAERVVPILLDFIGEDILLGHRILFDYSFIKRIAVNLKLSFEREGIDTLKLARKFLPDLESRKLDYLCSYYGIEHKAHRALGDAQATSDLFMKLSELFYDEKDFKPQKLVYQAKRETPITKPQKERLYKLIDKHKINIEYDLDKLTRNEASRITDRILAKYGR
ncbi:MAG: 3'-5' exonuclease [Clostridiales bacterium]|nr:3'-5' exonuclease [Clostridiales bacterium]